MKLPASKIELAASQENSRYTLNAIQYDVENKRFVASDGHIAAVIPAEVGDDDHTALIGVDTVKELRNIAKRAKNLHTEIRTNGKVSAEVVNGNCKAEFPVVDGQYPRIDMVKPSFEGPSTICLNAGLLIRLAQALNENATSKDAVVSLWIKDKQSGVGVKVSGNSQAWGIIMPCRE